MIGDEELERAESRGRELCKNVPSAVEAVYVRSIKRVLILLAGGLELSLRTSDHFAIRNATDDELTAIKLNADGFEIYFPKLDEGFWVPDLLERLLGVRKFLSHPVEERIAA